MPRLLCENIFYYQQNAIYQCTRYLKDNKHNSTHSTLKYRFRKTVCFSEQIMSAEKYSSLFLHQMEAVVYVSEIILFAVFWGGREGYHTFLNTDVRRELDHMGNFFQMVVGEHSYVFHQSC